MRFVRFSRRICARECELIDCGCGPGSITVDLAQEIAPGAAIGIDLREHALTHGRELAQERGIANVAFRAASIYQLPYADASFDAAFACAILQHLAAPLAALKEIRRVLKPGGVIGIVDGSATLSLRYPTNSLLDAWDRLRGLARAYNTGRPSDVLELRTLLRKAGFARTQASGYMNTEAGPPAGSLRGDAHCRAQSFASAPRRAWRASDRAGLDDEGRAGADGRSAGRLG